MFHLCLHMHPHTSTNFIFCCLWFTYLDINNKYVRGKTRSLMGERDFPGGTVIKNPPANAGGTGSSPSPGRSHMLRSN